MTKTATSALSALSKITPSSISPEPEAGLTDSVGEVTESPEVSEGVTRRSVLFLMMR